jgi:hypothetical protein
MKKSLVVGLLVAVTSFAATALGADTRVGTITQLTGSDTGKLLLRLNHTSATLCGDNAATGSAYIQLTAAHFPAVQPLLLAAFLAGKEVQLILTDTGAECNIDKATILP